MLLYFLLWKKTSIFTFSWFHLHLLDLFMKYDFWGDCKQLSTCKIHIHRVLIKVMYNSHLIWSSTPSKARERVISTYRSKALAVLKPFPLQKRRKSMYLIDTRLFHPSGTLFVRVCVCQGGGWIHYCETAASLQHYSLTKLNHIHLLTDKCPRIQRGAVV